MKKTPLRYLLPVMILFYTPLHTMAWGMLGHRIVAEIADHHLKKKTRTEINKILGSETIAMASNWMDFIKSDPSFRYLNSWHYVNLPKGLTLEQAKALLKKDTSANAYNKIAFLSTELRKKTLPLQTKQMYLRMLVHIVGDIHQPLHCGREEDKGGNDIRIKWFNKSTNLHTLWDSDLIEYQQLSYTEYATALDHPSSRQLASWQKVDVAQWIFDSYQISEKLYKEVESGQSTNYSYRYNFEHVDDLNTTLLKGGVRLAALLNSIFAR